jgi:anhydro-N-acetylmuramic acid kinase
MDRLQRLIEKPKRLCIGLMSGTSLDGMDAALVEIEGSGPDTHVHLRQFYTLPYAGDIRALLMEAVMGERGGSRTVCCLNVLLGETALRACREVCEREGIAPQSVDLVGSHGQTIYHLPEETAFGGSRVRGTLQIGEAAIIAEGLGCPVVSDFRVRDMAANGQGAPLVPYTEYILYRSNEETRALLNLGGIANITILPAGGGLEDIIAFDTGPGNMIIDAVVKSGAGMDYDQDGRIAGRGKVCAKLLHYMRDRDASYQHRLPPKSTGREVYNHGYMTELFKEAEKLGLSPEDTAATVTFYTADSIRTSLDICGQAKPGGRSRLIVSGGGAHNPTLIGDLKKSLPGWELFTAGEMGINGDAKEAVAFAVLANETVHGICNNAPQATGAAHPVIMGKISL